MIDVVVAGGGFSGTLAAVLLARAGYRVALVDRHPVYPDDFRAEHLDQVQAEALNRMQLLDGIVSDTPCVRRVVAAYHGRVVGLWPTINYGIRYSPMVNAARALLPPYAELVIGRIVDLETGPVHQRIMLADGRVLTARLLVLATGLGYALCSRLGISRRVLHERHSLTFGFDMQPLVGDRFPFPFLVYQGERVLNQIDYLAAFEIGATMRANLFTYRDYRDPWTQALLREPDRVLNEVLPGLAQVMGTFRVSGPVQARAMELYASDGFRRPGVVLIGDAFQTACPAAGRGITRALTDVERLCTVHVPRWLMTPDMAVEKINTFYDDPVKQACDAQAIRTAHYRRALTTGTEPRWILHRRRLRMQWFVHGLVHRVSTRLKGQPA